MGGSKWWKYESVRRNLSKIGEKKSVHVCMKVKEENNEKRMFFMWVKGKVQSLSSHLLVKENIWKVLVPECLYIIKGKEMKRFSNGENSEMSSVFSVPISFYFQT